MDGSFIVHCCSNDDGEESTLCPVSDHITTCDKASQRDTPKASGQVAVLLQALNLLSDLASLDSEVYEATIKRSASSDDDEADAVSTDSLSTEFFNDSNHKGQFKQDGSSTETVITDSSCSSFKSASDLQLRLDELNRSGRLDETNVVSIGASIHRWHASLALAQDEIDHVRKEVDSSHLKLQKLVQERHELRRIIYDLQARNAALADKFRTDKRNKKQLFRLVRSLHESVQNLEQEKQELEETNRILRMQAHERTLLASNRRALSCNEQVMRGGEHATISTFEDDTCGAVIPGSDRSSSTHALVVGQAEVEPSDLSSFEVLDDAPANIALCMSPASPQSRRLPHSELTRAVLGETADNSENRLVFGDTSEDTLLQVTSPSRLFRVPFFKNSDPKVYHEDTPSLPLLRAPTATTDIDPTKPTAKAEQRFRFSFLNRKGDAEQNTCCSLENEKQASDEVNVPIRRTSSMNAIADCILEDAESSSHGSTNGQTDELDALDDMQHGSLKPTKPLFAFWTTNRDTSSSNGLLKVGMEATASHRKEENSSHALQKSCFSLWCKPAKFGGAIGIAKSVDDTIDEPMVESMNGAAVQTGSNELSVCHE